MKRVLQKQEILLILKNLILNFLLTNFCIFHSIWLDYTKVFKTKILQFLMKGTTCVSFFQFFYC